MADLAGAMRLFVVVPCHNEMRGIEATLAALALQTDPAFELIVVDNASTDATRDVIEAWQASQPSFPMRCIAEPEKGTGAAADTGFRCAIAAGATHVARTDADCLPRRDWIASIKRSFDEGAGFVAGRIGFRSDDCRIAWPQHAILFLLMTLMRVVAPLLPHNRSPTYKARYVMASGGNLAVTSALYVASGGFPRIGLEDDNDDRILVNRIRTVSARLRRDRRVAVYQSARRIKHYGFRNSVLWYWNRKYTPDVVDIR